MLEEELIVFREEHLLHHSKALDHLQQVDDIKVALQLLNTLVDVEIFRIDAF